MSVCEMIELANRIVNGEPVKTPAIEAWIISAPAARLTRCR